MTPELIRGLYELLDAAYWAAEIRDDPLVRPSEYRIARAEIAKSLIKNIPVLESLTGDFNRDGDMYE